MGNWRTVMIDGYCDPSEVPKLSEAIDPGVDFSNHHALASGGAYTSIYGLNDWAAARIVRTGNLAERGFSVEDVAASARKIVESAPSFEAKIHCGGDYESKTCVATITVEAGEVSIGEPEVRSLPERSEAEIAGNFMTALRTNPRR